MKKSILMIAALATMVACSKDETVETVAKVPIAFGTSHVDNSTRAIDASYTNSNLAAFKVYGTVQGLFEAGDTDDGDAVNIFDGDDVNKPSTLPTNGAWSCSEIQYWIPNAAYKFVAIADDNVADETTTPADDAVIAVDAVGMPTTITYDAKTQKDLLYAEAIENTSSQMPNAPVAFTFSHLLSKAYFTVNNTITGTTGKYAYKVIGVKITNAQQKGTYTISTEQWAAVSPVVNYSEVDPLDFGAVTSSDNTTDNATAQFIVEKGNGATPVEGSSATSRYARFLIPATYGDANSNNEIGLIVKYTVELYMHNGSSATDGTQYTKINSTDYKKYLDYTFVAGHAYNFVINIGAPGSKIEFKISDEGVDGWETEHDNPADTSDNDDITLS